MMTRSASLTRAPASEGQRVRWAIAGRKRTRTAQEKEKSAISNVYSVGPAMIEFGAAMAIAFADSSSIESNTTFATAV